MPKITYSRFRLDRESQSRARKQNRRRLEVDKTNRLAAGRPSSVVSALSGEIISWRNLPLAPLLLLLLPGFVKSDLLAVGQPDCPIYSCSVHLIFSCELDINANGKFQETLYLFQSSPFKLAFNSEPFHPSHFIAPHPARK